MNVFWKALKTLIGEFIVACIATPFIILIIGTYELLDPFVRFYDTLHDHKKNQKQTYNGRKKK